jgi:hypothetical protein
MMPFLLFAVVIPLFFFACKDDFSPVDPTATLDPLMGLYDGPQDASAQRITELIMSLFPDPDPENEALQRWGNVQRLMDQGPVHSAQSQMRTFASQVVRFYNEGILEDPPAGSDVPPTTKGAVRELVSRLFIFVGLDAADALESFPEDMPEDYGTGVIEPDAEDETVITTGNNWAAVVAPVGAIGEDPVYIDIELLDKETCDEGGPLLQAKGCWNITRFPQGDFEQEVTVEVCAADNPELTDEQWELLLVHRRDEVGNITPLPWVDPVTINCQDFTVPEQTASLNPASTLLASLGDHLADFLLPEPLGAVLQTRPSSRRLGGLTGSFSEFFGAVPAYPLVTVSLDADGSIPGVVPTLADAMVVVEPEGTILMDEGIHTVEDVVVDKPVTIDEVVEATATIQNNEALTSLRIDGFGTGMVTIQNLDFVNISPGGTEPETWTSSIEVGGEYDQVVIQGNAFTTVSGSDPGTSGIWIDPSSVSEATVSVDNNAFSGGQYGLIALGAEGTTDPSVTVNLNTFTDHGRAGIQFQRDFDGVISGNTMEDCGEAGCIRVYGGLVDVQDNIITEETSMPDPLPQDLYHNAIRFSSGAVGTISGNVIHGCGWGSCIQVTFGASADVHDNTIEGYVEHGTVVGILAFGGGTNEPPPEYRPTVAVTDNTIVGMSEDLSGKPFSAGAIEMRNASGTDVSRNTITNAQWALSLFQNGVIEEGSDNIADDLHGVLRSTYNTSIDMVDNDFINWEVSISDSDGTLTGSLACNWWGSPAGPSNFDFPAGSPVVYSPWTDGPVAGDATANCPPVAPVIIDFEDEAVGYPPENPPTGVTYDLTIGTCGSQEPVPSGTILVDAEEVPNNQYTEIHRTACGGLAYDVEVPPVPGQGVYTVSWRLYMPSTFVGGNVQVRDMNVPGTGTYAAVNLGGGSATSPNIGYNNTLSSPDVPNVPADQWHLFEMEIDFAAQTTSLYVTPFGGSRTAAFSGVAFWSPGGDEITTITLSLGGGATGPIDSPIWWDDIGINNGG